MTWQCTRCKVTYRESAQPSIYKCEVNGCHVKYGCGKERGLREARTRAVDPAIMRINPARMYSWQASPAMEEYRRHYERDFGHDQ